MPTYEIVYDAEERGVMYQTLDAAVRNAYTGMEVWQLADDDVQTRVCCVWPVPPVRPEPEHLPIRLLTRLTMDEGRARRIAAALVNQYPHATYSEIVALVAYAYAKGNRDGYGEAVSDVSETLARLREEVQR